MRPIVLPDNIDLESKKQLVELFENTYKSIDEALKHFSQVSFKRSEFKHRKDFIAACLEGQSQFSKLVELKFYLDESLEILDGRETP